MTIDFDRINTAAIAVLESLCHQWLPAGRREGNEYKCGDLTGSAGRSLSINLNSGVWKDFSSDAGGSDPISLLAAIRNVSMGEAAKELDELLRTGAVKAPEPRAKSSSEDWIAEPEGDRLPPPEKLNHPKFGRPAAFWNYPGHGVICRFNTSDGGKEIVPLSWCRNVKTGDRAWRWKAFRKPRPLYHAGTTSEGFTIKPGAGFVIVEGEKAADAAGRLLPMANVVTWPGGSKAVRFADFTPLAGAKVIIWPDADEPGQKAAEAIREILPQAFIVTPPAHVPEGWDLADAESEGCDTASITAWIKRCRTAPAPAPETGPEPGPGPEERFEPPADYVPADEPPPRSSPADDFPFRCLGFDSGLYYYLPDSAQQVIALSAGGHTKSSLLALASLNFWEETFPAKSGFNVDAAANSLIRMSERVGVFDSSRIRGRGAWLDKGQVVFHAGDRLIVDGEPVDISRFSSSEIYPRSHRMQVELVEQARNQSAAKLIELCESMMWKHALNAKFMAGWLAVAPICGVLEWRPHIWLNGPSGSGKTWFLSNVVGPILGKSALYVQSNTSEAGIRQSLGCDALPVVFDEAESENQRDAARIQAVLILARQASRDTDARIVKGSVGGQATAYQIRSSFLFSSIAIAASQRSDMSRITALELTRHERQSEAQAQFDRLCDIWKGTAALPEWCAAIRSRSLLNAATIAANARTFARAATPFLGAQRDGDQIGALLAGAFSLTSVKKLSLEAATAWCEQQDWSAFKPQDEDQDERQALAHLLSSVITYEDGEGRIKNRTVGELIEGHSTYTVEDNTCARSLIRAGISLKEKCRVIVANKHPILAKIFSETPYSGKWAAQFARIPGAEKITTHRFAGSISRAVSIPINAILG